MNDIPEHLLNNTPIERLSINNSISDSNNDENDDNRIVEETFSETINVPQIETPPENENIQTTQNSHNPIETLLVSEIDLIQSIPDDEELVLESLETLQQNEQTLFGNFVLLSKAVALLLMLLRKYPLATNSINQKIKLELLKVWRLKMKNLAVNTLPASSSTTASSFTEPSSNSAFSRNPSRPVKRNHRPLTADCL